MKLRAAIAAFLGIVGIIAAMLIHMSCGKEPATQGVNSDRAGKTAGASSIHHYNIPRQDGNNPYSGRYSHRDLWVIEHAVAETDSSKPNPEGVEQLSGIVDGDGYLIPEIEHSDQVELALTQGVYLQQMELDRTREVRAIGQPYTSFNTEAIAYHAARMKTRAKYCPRIPKWLADNPPAECQIFPDGSVVSVGLLGGIVPLVNDNYVAPGFALYSPQGKFIKSTEYDWYLLFMSPSQMAVMTADAESRGWDGEILDSFGMGLAGMCDKAGELVALYNYDGTPLTPLDVMSHKRDMHNFLPIKASQIKELYALQQE
jgi:hypothetical protein